ncbi:MAG: hypothetical protein EA401_14145 [Planctomycetota bacterium]|nr:MAG: hypothetical protein EA401_14145 [Planctomycetota bacterium]
MKRLLALACVLCWLTIAAAEDVGDGWRVMTSSAVGVPGDRVVAAAIQSDGHIVLAAHIQDGPFIESIRRLQPGDAVVLRLSPDGREVVSAIGVGTDVRDMVVDHEDHVILALGKNGVVRVQPQLDGGSWVHDVGGLCARVDVGEDGTVVALRYDNDTKATTGSGELTVISPQGRVLGQFSGYRHTTDAIIDSASETVVHIGWRQARAHDGNTNNPVQIAYIRGVGYDGEVKYLLYDWSTDRNHPRFLNQPTNNMADTRGYRLTRGPDGTFYAGFECAGGNHIFRYEPQLNSDDQWVRASGKRHQGDRFFEWTNSRSEHKLFVARYNAETGEYLRGQQFAGRHSSGRTNGVGMGEGALVVDDHGRLLAGESAAAGLPLTFDPPDLSAYTGGGYLLMLSPNMDARPIVTRFTPTGTTHALAARSIDGVDRIVFAGSIGGDDAAEGVFFRHQAIQEVTPGNAGFVSVLHKQIDPDQ